jgi:hypothetical protein
MSFTITLMPDQPAPEIELLRAAYAAFNAQDIDAALATMTSDVALPNGMEGAVMSMDIKQLALTGRGNGPSSIRTMSQFPFIGRIPGVF